VPEEARAQEGLGQSHLEAGNPRQAVTHLRQALAIYQRIGAPGAPRVQRMLEDHRLTSGTAEPKAQARAGEEAS